MYRIICFFKGHKHKLVEIKQERLIRFGETAPQYNLILETYCDRCGAWQHPFRGDWITNA